MNAESIKKMRKDSGLSIEKAARCVHICSRSWARYESGERKIPDGIIHLFCLLNDLPVKKYLKND